MVATDAARKTKGAGGSVGRVRDAVSTSRGDSDAEAMQNLAYVVSSANENIVALQRTVKLQEKELTDKSEHTAALQRNYETLSRIRQSDQKEFIALKAQQAEEREELERLKGLYEEEQQKTLMLEQKLQTTAEAEAQLQHAKLELANAARERDEFRVAGEKHQRAAAEAVEGNRSLKLNLDKLTRSQQELLSRAKKAEDALSTVEGEREAGDKANAQALAKLAVQERQLKTFLEANMALEGDLGRQVQRVAQLERRKQELEAEQATIEAYYQARLEEMQAQYDKLLGEVESVKQQARDEVFKTFDDNREHVPGGTPAGSPRPGAKAES